MAARHLPRTSLILTALLPLLALFPNQTGALPTQPPAPGLPGCTVFYGFDGQTALGGNNEDFNNPLTLAWFIPATPGHFGRVYFGYDDYLPQGGVNDQGVFFDGLALAYKAMPATSARLHFPGGDLALTDEILARSANAQDVIDIAGRWNRAAGEYAQNLYGDRFGDSVIIDGDTVLRKQGTYQLATNFRLVDNPNPPYPEERYGLVSGMLSRADHFSVDLFRQALAAAHAEGDYPTLYSQVYELKTGIIHLYQYHDFEHEVVINLAAELAKGPHVVTIASLFPKNADREQWAAQQQRQWTAAAQALVNKSIPPDSQSWMSGDYTLPAEPEAGLAKVYLDEGQLYLQRPNQFPITLYPAAADTVFHHFFNGMDLSLTFQRDPSGQVTGAQGTFSFKPYNISLPYNLTPSKGSASATSLPNTDLWIGIAGAGIVLIVLGALLAILRGRGHAPRP
jgi:hypothetical protein